MGIDILKILCCKAIIYARVGATVSDGADNNLEKVSTSGNFNFKKQASQSDNITFKGRSR